MQALDRFRLDGRTALVTGASSGIGAVLALGLAQAGATVIAAARRADRLQRVVSDIVAAGGKAHAVALDVTAEDSIRAAFDHAEALAGIVDVLINNAGVAEPSRFVTTEAASRDHVMATNFNGVWNVTQEAARRIRRGLQGADQEGGPAARGRGQALPDCGQHGDRRGGGAGAAVPPPSREEEPVNGAPVVHPEFVWFADIEVPRERFVTETRQTRAAVGLLRTRAAEAGFEISEQTTAAGRVYSVFGPEAFRDRALGLLGEVRGLIGGGS